MSSKRPKSTIIRERDIEPFDELIPAGGGRAAAGHPKEATAPKATMEPENSKGTKKIKKLKTNVELPEDLLERLRNAVYWTPGLTLNQVFVTALAAELGRLEEQRGTPFPSRAGKLPTGPRGA